MGTVSGTAGERFQSSFNCSVSRTTLEKDRSSTILAIGMILVRKVIAVAGVIDTVTISPIRVAFRSYGMP